MPELLEVGDHEDKGRFDTNHRPHSEHGTGVVAAVAVEVARADVDAREGEARMRRAQRPPVGDDIDVEQMQGGDIAARATHMRRKGVAGACFRFFCCFSFIFSVLLEKLNYGDL